MQSLVSFAAVCLVCWACLCQCIRLWCDERRTVETMLVRW